MPPFKEKTENYAGLPNPTPAPPHFRPIPRPRAGCSELLRWSWESPSMLTHVSAPRTCPVNGPASPDDEPPHGADANVRPGTSVTRPGTERAENGCSVPGPLIPGLFRMRHCPAGTLRGAGRCWAVQSPGRPSDWGRRRGADHSPTGSRLPIAFARRSEWAPGLRGLLR